MDLKTLLNDEDSKLHRHIQDIRDAAGHILENPLHHHYTDHSLRHSERVIEILNSLTEVLMGSAVRLSATEIYILLAAAYLHDIGMQDRQSIPDIEHGSVYPDETYYEAYIAALERIRDRHHEFTRRMILDYIFQNDGHVNLGLPRIPIIDEKVALVAEAHRKVDLSHNSFEEIPDDQGRPIRPRLLAALLRFADELDIDHNRVYMDKLALINPPIDSRFYWYLCYYVHAVHVQNELITIWYRFPEGSLQYEKLIEPFVEDTIRTTRSKLINIFWPNRVRPEINPNSQRLFSPLVKPWSREVEKFAYESLARLKQEKVMLPSSDSLASEILDAR